MTVPLSSGTVHRLPLRPRTEQDSGTGVLGRVKVIAQLMGHAKVDTTLNV
jgi:hypothetical protein